MCRVRTHPDYGSWTLSKFYFSLINPSSGLQNKDILQQLLKGVTEARDDLQPSPLTSKRPKVVLKIAPDLDEAQLIEMAEVIRDSKIDGVIISNTTIQRPKELINSELSSFCPYQKPIKNV